MTAANSTTPVLSAKEIEIARLDNRIVALHNRIILSFVTAISCLTGATYTVYITRGTVGPEWIIPMVVGAVAFAYACMDDSLSHRVAVAQRFAFK